VSTGGVTESAELATVAAPAPAAVDSVELVSATAAAPADQGSGTMASLASAGGAIAITPENSKIGFVGSKDEGTHDGGFTDFAGSIDLAAGRIEVEINVDSIFTDENDLTAHLKSPDFFEVLTYPTAKFVSKSITAVTEGNATHRIEGELTLHGVTKPLAFLATIDEQAGTLKSELALNRFEWDIAYGKGHVHDEVKITIEVGSGS